MDLNFLKKSRLVHLCMAISFFTSGVLVNFIQGILYLGLRPFNKVLYRKINWYLCWTMYARKFFHVCINLKMSKYFVLELVMLGDWWSNTRMLIYSDQKIFNQYYGKEHAFCVMNHSYEVDWLIGWMLADRVHCLGVFINKICFFFVFINVVELQSICKKSNPVYSCSGMGLEIF